MPDKYILDSKGNPVPCADFLTWARWFETQDRHLRLDEISGLTVSTVFLGLDNRITGEGRPLLWETMVFGGTLDQGQERYSTRAEALAGHQRWVERVKRELRAAGIPGV